MTFQPYPKALYKDGDTFKESVTASCEREAKDLAKKGFLPAGSTEKPKRSRRKSSK